MAAWLIASASVHSTGMCLAKAVTRTLSGRLTVSRPYQRPRSKSRQTRKAMTGKKMRLSIELPMQFRTYDA